VDCEQVRKAKRKLSPERAATDLSRSVQGMQ
jgi:hypothetical protein